MIDETRTQAAVTGPVFLVGCPRSGTTLLQQMLNAHPDVAIAPETHFIRRFWLQRDSYGDLRDATVFGRFIEDLTAMPEFAEMGLVANEFRTRATRVERTHAAVFWVVLEQFAEGRRARIVGEKTPNHLLHMPTLQRFFPGARFIHIIRDARAVVNSCRHIPWSTGTVAGDAEVWRRYLARARRCGPAAGTIVTVHYEDLVRAPEATLRALCEFLRLDFDAAMLAHEKARLQTINVAREPWKSNATREINQAPLDRWRRELRSEAVREIEAVAWAEMGRVGYATETSWQRLAPLAGLRLIGRAKRRVRRRLTVWLH